VLQIARDHPPSARYTCHNDELMSPHTFLTHNVNKRAFCYLLTSLSFLFLSSCSGFVNSLHFAKEVAQGLCDLVLVLHDINQRNRDVVVSESDLQHAQSKHVRLSAKYYPFLFHFSFFRLMSILSWNSQSYPIFIGKVHFFYCTLNKFIGY
jgi:hypothetical protein